MTPIQVVMAYSEALSQGDISSAFSHFSPDARWHQPGNHRFAGTKVGQKEIGEMLAEMMESTQGSLVIDPTGALMSIGNYVSFPVRFVGENGEKEIDMTGVDLFEVVDEKIVQVWLFSEDQVVEDAFWG